MLYSEVCRACFIVRYAGHALMESLETTKAVISRTFTISFFWRILELFNFCNFYLRMMKEEGFEV